MASQVDWRLCFIADSEATAGRDVLVLIEEAVAGGATLIQLRGKKWTDREFLNIGLDAQRLLRPKGIPLFINDRVDMTIGCEADGVHLGQDDMPLAAARKILGPRKIIGVSVAALEKAISAEKGGANYLGVGPVFPTLSKEDVNPPLGLEGLSIIRAHVRLPILAIGGITPANAGQVISAGADGVAVISAIASAPDRRQAATKFIEAIGKVRK